jgi:hypothetical protein
MGFDDDRISGIDNPVKTDRSETIFKAVRVSTKTRRVGRSIFTSLADLAR